MSRFILRRLVLLVATVFVASVLAFLVPYLGAGDPARTILRSRVSDLALDPATVEAVRQQFGLDQPVYVQYVRWLQAVLSGDLGLSFTSNQPVIDLVIPALRVSVLLAVAALLLACVIAIPLGVAAAVRAGRPLDSAILAITQGFVALPEYWLAPLGILVFAVWLGVLPSAGWTSPASIVLPAAVLALRPLAYLLSVTRAAVITVLGSQYIIAARSRGLSQRQTMWRHAPRNAAVPVMTLFSIWLAGTISGSVVVEVIFSIPGLGRLMYSAVVNTDIPVLQAGVIVTVSLAVVINTVTDIGYAILNPAVVVGEARG